MTKAEIVHEIARKTGMDKTDVMPVVELFMDVVKDSLAHGESVFLRGFGTFGIKYRAPKKARNISKNEEVYIQGHNIPAFKPSTEFKKRVK